METYSEKLFILLQADQLLDITTGQLLCIICKQEVQEDMSGMPRHDTRLLLTKFNEQMEPLFNLLREVRARCLCMGESDVALLPYVVLGQFSGNYF